MPGYPNVVIKDSSRIGAELELAMIIIEEAKEEFGLDLLVTDPELKKLEGKFSGICYPFLTGLREINSEFDKWFEEKIKERSQENENRNDGRENSDR